PVILRGVGLGGWMNMENFITGFPATESLHRDALRRAIGDAASARFFDRFLDVFYADADAAFLASLGMNLVRLPVNYRHFEDDMHPFELREEGFRLLDRAIERSARTGSTRSSTSTRFRARRTSDGTATTRRIARSSGRTATSRIGSCTSGKRSPTAIAGM